VKVLHLGAGNMFGGVETFLVTLAQLRHLAPGMDPEFALSFRGRLWDELTAAGVPVFDLGGVRVSRPWTVLRARRALRGVMAERKPDVVVTHSGWVHAVFAAAVRTGGTRLAFFAHGPPARLTLLDRWAARTCPDVAIANSRFTAASVPNLFPGVPTDVAYLPVRLEPPRDRAGVRAAVRAELNTPDDAVVILTASRMERWKGHPVLLEAFGRLRGEPGWVSWVVGGAQRPDEVMYLDELKATAVRSDIADRVRFLGQRTDVARLLAAADIHCQPNTGPEPFGLAFVEALAAGLPVVTSAIGGGAEIITDTCGVLVPPGDSVAVAAALRELLSDPIRRQQLGAGGPDRARQLCDPAVTLTRLARLLDRR
jgi:glycosyltransferase involved in cell wall biosynthesis